MDGVVDQEFLNRQLDLHADLVVTIDSIRLWQNANLVEICAEDRIVRTAGWGPARQAMLRKVEGVHDRQSPPKGFQPRSNGFTTGSDVP